MIVCVCRRVNDKAIAQAARCGASFDDIQIDMGVSDRMVDLIGDHVDCVLRGGEIVDQSLMARRVADLPIGAYAAPAYLRHAGTPAPPSALATATR